MNSRCVNGHEFDSSKYQICPKCGEPAAFGGVASYGPTEPSPDWGGGNSGAENYGGTMPPVGGWDVAQQGVQDFQGGAGFTMPPYGGGGNTQSAVEWQPPQPEQKVEDYDSKTRSVNQSSAGRAFQVGNIQDFGGVSRVDPMPETPAEPISPVVGWLVCTTGQEKGRSYPIHPENNYVGRSESMDICINDDVISRENQFVIAYVSRTRKFYAHSTGGRNITELNDLPLGNVTELHPYDRFTVGYSNNLSNYVATFIFIPFCGEQFGWDEVEGSGRR